ncbi:MAG: flagellar biosynthetic protein FliQ [Myxococcota bacterium]
METIEQFVVKVTTEGILLMLIISAPAILVSLAIGLAVALFSATTQIQEQTLSFVPKLVVVFAVLAATAGWMGSLIMRYTVLCFTGFVDLLK